MQLVIGSHMQSMALPIGSQIGLQHLPHTLINLLLIFSYIQPNVAMETITNNTFPPVPYKLLSVIKALVLASSYAFKNNHVASSISGKYSSISLINLTVSFMLPSLLFLAFLSIFLIGANAIYMS